jgi:protein gp37
MENTMADKSAIEWTDATWNPIVGCSILSPGCTHCYAMGMAARIEAMTVALKAKGQTGAPHYDGTTRKAKGTTIWTGKVALAPDHILTEPLTWKRPRKIFVNSMGDLFHEDVPDAWIDKVFAVMALAPQHTFQVLTKRAKRMREYMNERWQPAPAHRLAWPGGDAIDIPAETKGEDREDQVRAACEPFLEKLGLVDTDNDELWTEDGNAKAMTWTWPLKNVWLGVSAERQTEWDERTEHLVHTPAATRFVSIEPMLGPIDCRFGVHHHPDNAPSLELAAVVRAARWHVANFAGVGIIDWIIVGGESGPGARPMHPDWARSIRDQCAAAGVPFFFKQWGEWAPHKPTWGGDLGGDVRAGRVEIVHPTGQSDIEVFNATGGRNTIPGSRYMARLGKKAAGRLLDGVEHDAMPVSDCNQPK